jgi:hypothetical protein
VATNAVKDALRVCAYSDEEIKNFTPRQTRGILPMPDRNEVERFLIALDPRTKQFTFQTFDDDKQRREARKKAKQRAPRARVLHGTLAQYGNTLVKLNQRGAGIFVTINKTVLHGRTYEHSATTSPVFPEVTCGVEFAIRRTQSEVRYGNSTSRKLAFPAGLFDAPRV